MDTMTRGLTPAQIDLYYQILRAVTDTARVEVTINDHRGYRSALGIARYVVEREDGGFAYSWHDDCKLRLTTRSGFEVFIRFGDIAEINVLSEWPRRHLEDA